jgi:hypothetical protein
MRPKPLAPGEYTGGGVPQERNFTVAPRCVHRGLNTARRPLLNRHSSRGPENAECYCSTPGLPAPQLLRA